MSYLFCGLVCTYDQVATLTASDAATGDYFGYSVAIDGNPSWLGPTTSDRVYAYRTSDGGAMPN